MHCGLIPWNFGKTSLLWLLFFNTKEAGEPPRAMEIYGARASGLTLAVTGARARRGRLMVRRDVEQVPSLPAGRSGRNLSAA
jgi:hypothetical protein